MNDQADDEKESSATQHSDLRDLAPATSSRMAGPGLSARSLAALLDLICALQHESDPPTLVREFVAELSRVLPGHSVAVLVLDDELGQWLLEARPPTQAELPATGPTRRCFPELAHELSFPLDKGITGSVHLAGAMAVEPSSEEARVATRAAHILTELLDGSRRFQRLKRALSERVDREAQLIQIEKLASLGQIAAGVIHELNNPLMSIVAHAGHMANKQADPEDKERLEHIVEAAERMLQLSRDLVAYARPATQVPGPISVGQVVEKALVFCRHEFSGGGISVTQELETPEPLVLGNAGQLTQVFVNLFTNAAHAMAQRGGCLRVAASSEAAWVRIEVSDEGSGIDPMALPRIFDPFFTTKTQGQGSGLGLSIVRDIVQSHGGEVEARCRQGGGTTFILTLPLAKG